MTVRTCPAEGCQETVSPGFFACRHHWFKLPGHVRLALNRAWSDWMDGTINLAELQARQAEARRLLNPGAAA